MQPLDQDSLQNPEIVTITPDMLLIFIKVHFKEEKSENSPDLWHSQDNAILQSSDTKIGILIMPRKRNPGSERMELAQKCQSEIS